MWLWSSQSCCRFPSTLISGWSRSCVPMVWIPNDHAVPWVVPARSGSQPGPAADGELCSRSQGETRVNGPKPSCPTGSLKTAGCHLMRAFLGSELQKLTRWVWVPLWILRGLFSLNENQQFNEQEKNGAYLTESKVNRKGSHTSFLQEGIYMIKGFTEAGLMRSGKAASLLTLGRCMASWGDQLPAAKEAARRHIPESRPSPFCGSLPESLITRRMLML